MRRSSLVLFVVVSLVLVLVPVVEGPAVAQVSDAEIGRRGIWSFESWQLSDRRDVGVNVATGNLSVRELDLVVQGTAGLSATVERFYNSLDASAAHDLSDVGSGWQFAPMGVSRLVEDGADVVVYADGALRFTDDGNGGFNRPLGTRASLAAGTSPFEWEVTWWESDMVWRFDTDGNGLGWLAEVEDRNGNTVSLSHSQSGGDVTLDSLTDSRGRTVTFDTNGNNRITEVEDSASRVVAYTYDGNGRLATMTDPEHVESHEYSYDANGFLEEIEDPDDQETIFDFDGGGRVTEVRRVLDSATNTGVSWLFAYDDVNQETTVTDPNGHDTVYEWDGQGRVVTITDALSRSQALTYTTTSNVATQMGASLAVRTLSYSDDDFDNLTEIEADTGMASTLSSTFAYTDPTHPHSPTSHTNPQGHTLNYSYDGAGNLAQVEDDHSLGGLYELVWNADGTLDYVDDPRDVRTDFAYNGDAELTGVDNPAPLGDETFGYDSLSRLTSYTDGNGDVTAFEYDDLDHLTKVTFDDLTTVTFVWDGQGNLASRVDAAGTTAFTYDPIRRLTDISYPDGTSPSFGYDAVGNLIDVATADGAIEYEYDDANQMILLVEPDDDEIDFAYDTNGFRDTITYPNGVTETFEFDAAGRVHDITAADATTDLTDFSYDYENATSDDTALRHSVTGIDGNTTTYQYDQLGRLIGSTTETSGSVVVSDLDYGYDAASNRTAVTDDGATVDYTYNNANQLTHQIPQAGDDAVLVVADDTSLTGGDQALKDRLEATHLLNVTVVDDDDAENVTDQELVVISESSSLPALNGKYDHETAVPVVNLERAAWDEHFLTTQNGAILSTNSINVEDPDDPLVDGPYGTVTGTFNHAGASVQTGYINGSFVPSSGDDTILETAASTSNNVAFTYEKGSALANGVAAPARRVGLGFSNQVMSAITSEGWVVFDNAIAWALADDADTLAYRYDAAGNLTDSSDGHRYQYDSAARMTELTHPRHERALLIVGDAASLAPADAAVRDRLADELGMSVTVRDDNAQEHVGAARLVVISESVDSAAVASKYDEDLAVPVINMERSSWQEHRFGNGDGTYTTTAALDVEDPEDPLIDGPYGSLSGTFNHVTSAQQTAAAGNTNHGPEADHDIVTISGTSANVALTYDTGALMAGSVPAPARRVALGYHTDVIDNITAEGWTLFDNAVAWATTPPNPTTDTYTYRGLDQTERTGSGGLEYEHTSAGVAAVDDGTHRHVVLTDPYGGLIGAQDASTGDAVYFHTDALGSVVAVTDDSGQVTDTYSYDDWGNTTHVGVTDPTVVPFAYTGQPHDPSGLIHSGARYYQAPTGRWTQPDPLTRAVNPAQAAEVNPYLYVGANPINYTDPTGLVVCNDVSYLLSGLGLVVELAFYVAAVVVSSGAATPLVGSALAGLGFSIVVFYDQYSDCTSFE